MNSVGRDKHLYFFCENAVKIGNDAMHFCNKKLNNFLAVVAQINKNLVSHLESFVVWPTTSRILYESVRYSIWQNHLKVNRKKVETFFKKKFASLCK